MKLSINNTVLAAVGGKEARALTRARYLMGTVCTITAYGPRARAGSDAAFSEIERVESVLSTYRDQSELSRLNREGSRKAARVSPTLWDALSRAIRLARASSGAFDPTFASPPEARGVDRVHMSPGTRSVRLDQGTVLRLDAFGKGYALDRAAPLLRAEGVSAALLDFGGQILALGSPPSLPAWPVDLAPPGCPPRSDPRPASSRCIRPALSLSLRDASISTSGSSEQGEHIMDPATGKSVRRASSMAVVSASAGEADAWSTALFVRGLSALPRAFPACALELSPAPGGSRAVFAGSCEPLLREGRVSFPSDADIAPKETHP